MVGDLIGGNTTSFDISAFIAQAGELYEKIPGLRGFTVLHTEDDTYCAYNRLEDIEYRGPGYYIRGLVGEVWKLSFDSLIRSYVFDNGLDDEHCDLHEGLPQNLEIPIRYRDDMQGRILAARAPESLHEIETCVDGELFTLSFNAPYDNDGIPIDHGQGDYLAVPVAKRLDSISEPAISEIVRNRACYVVNGLVFRNTYRKVEPSRDTFAIKPSCRN